MVDRINAGLRFLPAWLIYVLAPIPVCALFYLGATGELGVDPTKRIEHELGLWSLWLLIAGLSVTPIRKWFGINLVKFRRAIGVVTFFYVVAHLMTWLVLDVQFQNVLEDIIKRWYITVGMISLLLMTPLALTSNNLSMRKLGAAKWRKLHKLVYPVAILGAVHYLLLVKGFQWEPLLYLSVILGLLTARLKFLNKFTLSLMK